FEIRIPKRLPFREDQQRIRTFHTTIIAGSQLNAIAEKLFRFVHSLWIVGSNGSALREQILDDFYRRRIPHVVRSRLECKAPYANALVAKIPVKVPAYLVDETRSLIPVNRIHSLEHLHFVLVLAAGIDESANVFGEAASAEADAGEQKRRTDSRI